MPQPHRSRSVLVCEALWWRPPFSPKTRFMWWQVPLPVPLPVHLGANSIGHITWGGGWVLGKWVVGEKLGSGVGIANIGSGLGVNLIAFYSQCFSDIVPAVTSMVPAVTMARWHERTVMVGG